MRRRVAVLLAGLVLGFAAFAALPPVNQIVADLGVTRWFGGGPDHMQVSGAAHVYGRFEFSTPGPVAVASGHVWVANGAGPGGSSATWVTELDAKTGTLVRVLSAPKYGFESPVGFAVTGDHLWVADGSGAVTELDAKTGALLRVVSGACDYACAITAAGGHVWITNGHGFLELDPKTGAVLRVVRAGGSCCGAGGDAIGVAGGHVWVPSGGGGSDAQGDPVGTTAVSELDAKTGSVVRVTGVFYQPGAIAVAGNDLWVASSDGTDDSGLTEFNGKTGAVIRTISFANYTQVPSVIAVGGGGVWVANQGGGSDSLMEFNESTGGLLRQGSYSNSELDFPGGITVAGGHVWVTSNYGNSVRELDGRTGALIRVMSNSK